MCARTLQVAQSRRISNESGIETGNPRLVEETRFLEVRFQGGETGQLFEQTVSRFNSKVLNYRGWLISCTASVYLTCNSIFVRPRQICVILSSSFSVVLSIPSSSFFRSREKIDYPGMQKKRQAIREGIIAFRNDVVL